MVPLAATTSGRGRCRQQYSVRGVCLHHSFRLTSSTDLINHTVSICMTDGSLALRLITGLTAHLVKSGLCEQPDQLRFEHIQPGITHEMSKHPMLQIRHTPEETVTGIAIVVYLRLKQIGLSLSSLQICWGSWSPIWLRNPSE
jgi:hypothetical protein